MLLIKPSHYDDDGYVKALLDFVADEIKELSSLGIEIAVVIGGVMQHIEEAGIHSGDSFAVLPPHKCSALELGLMRRQTARIARSLGVVGLMNIQYAIFENTVYVLEANPRASRTVPLVSKVCNVAMAKLATEVMLGRLLAELERLAASTV